MDYEFGKAINEKKNQDKVNKFSQLVNEYAKYSSIETAILTALHDMNKRRN